MVPNINKDVNIYPKCGISISELAVCG